MLSLAIVGEGPEVGRLVGNGCSRVSFGFFDTDFLRKRLLTPGPKAMSLRTHSKVKHMVKVKFM